MKHLLSISFVLIFGFMPVLGQVENSGVDPSSQESIQNMYDHHMSKQKKLNKTGFILLGAGVATSVAGVLVLRNSSLFDDGFASGTFLFLGGVLSTTASIPVFIVAGSHKKKATALVQIDKYPNQILQLSNSGYVSVGVRIDF